MVELELLQEIRRAVIVDLLEHKEFELKPSDNTLRVKLGPFDSITLELRFQFTS